MANIINKQWKVYRAPLRPGLISTVVMEIQTIDGETVIPWSGFDDLMIRGKRDIAARIVRLHNAELKRYLNAAKI